MDRNEWLKLRKSGLGGSDVAAVVGLSKWKTAYQVWEDKVSEEIIEIPDTPAMRWGRQLESTVAQAFMEETGREVQTVDGISRSSELPFMIGSIDRFIVADPDRTDLPEIQRGEGILEIKTVNAFAYKDWESSVPPYYYAQLMHYLYVTGLKWGAFAILVGGSDFRIFDVIRDDEYIRDQVEMCRKFWTENVQTNTPPSKVAADHSRSKFILDKPVLASTDVLGTLNDMARVTAEIKEREVLLASLKEQVQGFMGDHDSIMDDNQRPLATWKLQKGRTTLNTKLFKSDHPDLYEKYSSQGDPTRVFKLIMKEE